MLELATGLLLFVGGVATVGFALLLVLVLHEAAHALVGALVGFHVVAIEFGSGPCVRLWWLARVRIAWCRWPLHGLVYAILRGRRCLRLRILLFVLAGPASTIAIAIGCAAMLDHARAAQASDGLLECLQWATWLTSFLAVSSLLPIRCGEHRSDVELLFRALRMRRDEIERLVAGSGDAEREERFHFAFLRGNTADAAAAVAEMEAAHPQSWGPTTYKALLRLAAGDATGAMATHDECEGKLRSAASDEPRAADAVARLRTAAKLLAINRAFFLVHVGTEQALAEARRLADSWGSVREPHSPQQVAALRTRGLVLLHTGAVARGMTCLRQAIAAQEPYWLRALAMTYLAYGHALQGDERNARRWACSALALHPQGLLLPLRSRLADEALTALQAKRVPTPRPLGSGHPASS